MQNEIKELNTYHDSVMTIMQHCINFHNDISQFSELDFESWYEIVCGIPYIEDADQVIDDPEIDIQSGENFELNWRPKYILEKLEGADCKKKSILIGAFCVHCGIPVRFVVMSSLENKEPHHIFTEVMNSETSEWIPADATYPENRLGIKEPETFRKVFEYEYA